MFDLKEDARRLRMILPESEVAKVEFVQGDVTDLPALVRTITDKSITHIIHLAGLQVPTCRADPILGAKVNIIGTLAVFEAIRATGEQVKRLVYASSAAVYGGPDKYTNSPLSDDVLLMPSTHYGAFKCCNEANARLYFQDNGLSSVGLRPWTVYGVGRDGLRGVDTDLDCGNAGTAMRLLMGLLAGQKFSSKLVGDESLSRRPMKRVATPLEQMGAQIQTRHGTPPILIQASAGLKAINYRMPMASAQVKSAVLLAGLYADGVTSVSEPAPTRDHTERMLRGFGVAIQSDGSTTRIAGGQRLRATRIDVPADISSAAFFLVGASIAAGSDLTIEHVGLNPTRTGILDILKLMGANISVENLRDVGGEPVGDLRVRSALLRGIEVPPELVPLAIDEFPMLFVAAACAQGQTVVTGAEELRVKESTELQ